jgi:hypothetical protein
MRPPPAALLVLVTAVLAASSSAGAVQTGTMPGGLAPGQAKGTLTVNGQAVTLRYAYADRETNPFDGAKLDIVVVLTDRPIAADVLARHDIGGLPGAAEAAGVRNYVRLTLRMEGSGWEIGHRTISHDALKGKTLQVSPDPVSRFDGRAVTETRVEGTVHTNGPQTFPHDDTHEYEVSFNVAVMPVKPAAPPPPTPSPNAAREGTPLPAGGGDPGLAFQAYCEALRKGDLEGLQQTAMTFAEATASQLEEIRGILPLMAAGAPANVKVVRGWMDGADSAVLELTGVVMGLQAKGKAVMGRRGGAWLVVAVDWN